MRTMRVGGVAIQIEIVVDDKAEGLKVVVITDRMSEEAHEVIRRLEQVAPEVLLEFRDDTAVILNEADLIRVYAAGRKVFAEPRTANTPFG